MEDNRTQSTSNDIQKVYKRCTKELYQKRQRTVYAKIRTQPATHGSKRTNQHQQKERQDVQKERCRTQHGSTKDKSVQKMYRTQQKNGGRTRRTQKRTAARCTMYSRTGRTNVRHQKKNEDRQNCTKELVKTNCNVTAERTATNGQVKDSDQQKGQKRTKEQKHQKIDNWQQLQR